MKSIRKTTSIVAAIGAGALGVGLIGFGTGVGANFVDGATGSANVNVGTFGCQLSSTNPNVVLSDDSHTATVTLPTIQKSAAGSESVPLTVTNTGSISMVVNWRVTTAGSIFDSGNVTALPVAQNLAINGGNHRTYNIGVQWSTLGNADLATSGTVTYKASCDERPAAAHPYVTFDTHDGGTGTWSNGNVVLAVPSSPASAGAYLGINNAPASLPSVAPAITVDHAVSGTPRWDIHFTQNNLILFGFPTNNNSLQGLWRVNTGGPAMTWSEVLAAYGNLTVASVGVIQDTSGGGLTSTISCLQYNNQAYVGSGNCS